MESFAEFYTLFGTPIALVFTQSFHRLPLSFSLSHFFSLLPTSLHISLHFLLLPPLLHHFSLQAWLEIDLYLQESSEQYIQLLNRAHLSTDQSNKADKYTSHDFNCWILLTMELLRISKFSVYQKNSTIRIYYIYYYHKLYHYQITILCMSFIEYIIKIIKKITIDNEIPLTRHDAKYFSNSSK